MDLTGLRYFSQFARIRNDSAQFKLNSKEDSIPGTTVWVRQHPRTELA
jgi:hypothetical protein